MEILDRNRINIIEIRDKSALQNHIDIEIHRIFLPLDVMQMLVLRPKYHIRNNLINPNNYLNNFIVLVGTLMFLITYIWRIVEVFLDDFMIRYSTVNFLLFGSLFDFIYRCIGFIMNMLIIFTQSKNSVTFVLYFQEVHRFLKDKSNIKAFILRSWIGVAFYLGYYVFIFVYLYVFFLKPPWRLIVYVLIAVTFDANLIYVIRLSKLLTDKVVLWNIQLFLIKKNGCNKENIVKMISVYDKILKCYKIIIDMYRYPVSSFVERC